MSIILGIDPGSRVTGFAVIEKKPTLIKVISYGIIKAQLENSFPERILELGSGLKQILHQFNPQTVAIEKIFLGKNADSAFKLGHARGVVMYESAQYGCQVFEYATRLVKKGITGKGSADKVEVQSMLERFLNLNKIKRLDASDALALAVFHALREEQTLKMKKLINKEMQL